MQSMSGSDSGRRVSDRSGRKSITSLNELDYRLEGIPDDLRILFRQLIADGFQDRGESEDVFDFPEQATQPEEPLAEAETKTRNFGFGYLGQVMPVAVASEAMIAFGLSHAGRAVDSCQMAYLKLELRNKRLTNIDALGGYIHLRNVDLSDNLLTELSAIEPITNLQVLNVQGNQIKSMKDVPHFRWLQALNLSKNAFTSLEGFQPNYITYLSLSHNRLKSFAEYMRFDIFQNLLFLELRGNRLSSLNGINLPLLRHLYIAENHLTDLEGLSGCPALETLHARKNRIQTLTSFASMEKLTKVNLRENSIWQYTETIRLENCPVLEILTLSGNPIISSERYVLELTAACPYLKRLDKRILSEMELIDGRLLRNGRIKGMGRPLRDEEELEKLVIPPPPDADEVEWGGE